MEHVEVKWYQKVSKMAPPDNWIPVCISCYHYVFLLSIAKENHTANCKYWVVLIQTKINQNYSFSISFYKLWECIFSMYIADRLEPQITRAISAINLCWVILYHCCLVQSMALTFVWFYSGQNYFPFMSSSSVDSSALLWNSWKPDLQICWTSLLPLSFGTSAFENQMLIPINETGNGDPVCSTCNASWS